MEFKAMRRGTLLKEIEDKLNIDTREVALHVRPSVWLVVSMLNVAPNLRTLYLPRSLRDETSKFILTALRRIGVEVKELDRPRGRPRTRRGEVVDEVRRLGGEGVPAREISRRMSIPLRTVYYYLKTAGRRYIARV